MDDDVYRFERAYRCMRKRLMKMLCSAGSYQGHQERAEVIQKVVNNESDCLTGLPGPDTRKVGS
jgi:hypothetical protein